MFVCSFLVLEDLDQLSTATQPVQRHLFSSRPTWHRTYPPSFRHPYFQH